MPKVKFTALVSDMKGKANGSVFSSNKGGSYFRTNKTGGGRKTESWAIQKSSFADLSSTWKTLTEEQQQAWKDATTNYPTTNAFGELRYPTGYELYMRINGTLKAANQFILDVPETPRAMPDYAPLQIIIPDDYLFTPRQGIKSNSIDPLGIRLVKANMKLDSEYYTDHTWCCRFILDPKNPPLFSVGKIFEFGSYLHEDTVAMLLFGQVIANNLIRIWATFPVVDATEHYLTQFTYADFPISIIKDQIHLAVAFKEDGPSQIYFNGNFNDNYEFGYVDDPGQHEPYIIYAAPHIPEGGISYTQSDKSIRAVLGCKSNEATNFQLPCIISDFRVYNNDDIYEYCSNNNPCEEGYQCYINTCSVPSFNDMGYIPANIGKIFKGHILTTEVYAVGCYEVIDGVTPNYANNIGSPGFNIVVNSNYDACNDCTGYDFQCIDGICTYVGDTRNIITANPLTYGPLAVVKKVYIDGTDYAAQLSWSGLISNGKSLAQVPYKLLATLPISEVSINISQLLQARAGNFSTDAAWGFRAFLLDTYTGQRYASQMTISVGAKKKRPPGFKAGAELSGKCN